MGLFKKILLGFLIFGVAMAVLGGIIEHQSPHKSEVPPGDQGQLTAKHGPPAEETKMSAKARKIKEKHPNWSNEICNTISERKIFLGMNKDQVKAAWWKPYRINSTSTIYGGEREQWVMREGINSDLLYFDGEILTGIQQSK